ncbi:hypothetical protein [Vreelandella arcis]|uniref:Abi-like protein n=1 Tax=Vreelandella arcis TaxID=416873 RepID=A0A1G9ZSZ8_9GAMM|nr:hypothetical protein [Halomonas arcis]SDN24752.1 hypothetical protein SAMN04487951_103255 [Halomonas arcis]
MTSTKEQIQAIRTALTPARMSTYEKAANSREGDDPSALNLYVWNAQLSGAFMAPLHICEVVVRNAISDALEEKYGQRWPWSSGFEQSLPSPPVGYNPRQDLFNARRGAHTAGKVIPELKFAFWQRMFTRRHDHRLWNAHLTRILPVLDATKSVQELRQDLYEDLEAIRRLRNRIAHHEPIFNRNLAEDFERISRLIAYRSTITANWMEAHQQVRALLATGP